MKVVNQAASAGNQNVLSHFLSLKKLQFVNRGKDLILDSHLFAVVEQKLWNLSYLRIESYSLLIRKLDFPADF